MKTLIIYITFCIALSACKKINDADIGPQTGFMVSILDSNGNDLLDTTFANSYDTDNIKVYDIIEGEPRLYYNPNLDAARGYTISLLDPNVPDQKYVILGSGVHPEMHPDTTTVISRIYEWEEGDSDTITCKIFESKGRHWISDIYFNKELKLHYDSEWYDDRYFIAIK